MYLALARERDKKSTLTFHYNEKFYVPEKCVIFGKGNKNCIFLIFKKKK